MRSSYIHIIALTLGLANLWDNCLCVEILVKQSGSDLELTCQNNVKQPLEWKINANDSIPKNAETSQTQGNDVTSYLKLTNLNATNAGSYICSGVTDGEIYESVNVTIISISGRSHSVVDNVTAAQLSCEVDNDFVVSGIKWKRNGDELDNSDKYTIAVNGSSTSLTVNSPGDADAGVYTCVVTLEQMNTTEFDQPFSINVSPKVQPIKKPRSKVEGEVAKILCNVTGYPTPAVTWYRKLEDKTAMELITYDDRVNASAHNGVPAAALMIKDLKISTDRGDYTCVATNFLGSANATVTLKVKDKLAAVWPFLGICAEVAILCSIIFIFEKRRNRRLEEEEDVDAAIKQDLMKSNGTDEKDLRQRSNATKA